MPLSATPVEVDDRFLVRLRSICAGVSTDEPAGSASAKARAGRGRGVRATQAGRGVRATQAGRGVRATQAGDSWPLAVVWSVHGGNPFPAPAVVVRPESAAEVAACLALCAEERVPVTPAGGRSGVCGGALAVHGGVALDLGGLAGIRGVDPISLVADVGAGTFGAPLEAELRAQGLTLGHWPQSMDISTVGGWVACRSAGQYSTRYGKIEDVVVGLEVALAGGQLIRTGGHPRAATGPDLTQLFVGCEGTLGVITEARLRLRPAPATEQRAAFGFATFGQGVDACRHVLRRHATPAVLRLYDRAESDRHFGVDGHDVLIVVDEGDDVVVSATMRVVDEECRSAGGEPLDAELATHWLAHRNEVPALEDLARMGLVADTMEVAAPWAAVADVHRGIVDALEGVDGLLAATAHLSHAYVDGACLYVTFAGRPDLAVDGAEDFWRACWRAAVAAALGAGANLSHHHGVGVAKAEFLPAALGPAHDVLAAVKAALDPSGILNPGKLGLPDPFGDLGWP